MRPRLGVALGGGGARGLAHLGVLIVLEQAHVPVDAIAGTSMGAALGAARAIGTDLNKLEILFRCLDLNELLQVSDSTLRELQRIIGRSMIEYVRGSTWREEAAMPHDLARLNELFSLLTANKSFEDVRVPLAVVATDLETGERVVLNEGKLYDAVTASTAVPGVFSPVARGGRYLIDGGVVEKIPVDVVVDLGADVVIAVDTSAPLTRSVDTCLDALLQAQRVTSQRLSELQLERARERLGRRLLVLHPDVSEITMFGFEHTDKAVQAGKEEARAHLNDIRALLDETST
jgi:NTE family protein